MQRMRVRVAGGSASGAGQLWHLCLLCTRALNLIFMFSTASFAPPCPCLISEDFVPC